MHVSHNPAPLVITIKNNLTYNYYFEFFEQLSQMGFITPIFQFGKRRPREVEQLDWGHRAGKWLSQDGQG